MYRLVSSQEEEKDPPRGTFLNGWRGGADAASCAVLPFQLKVASNRDRGPQGGVSHPPLASQAQKVGTVLGEAIQRAPKGPSPDRAPRGHSFAKFTLSSFAALRTVRSGGANGLRTGSLPRGRGLGIQITRPAPRGALNAATDGGEGDGKPSPASDHFLGAAGVSTSPSGQQRYSWDFSSRSICFLSS